MNISSVEKELNNLLSLIARWKEQQYTPDIERDIALDRLRNIYAEFLGIKCEKLEPTTELTPKPQPDPEPENHTTCAPEISEEQTPVSPEIEATQDENPCPQADETLSDSQIEGIAQVIDDITQPVYEPQIEELPQQEEVAQEAASETEVTMEETPSLSSEDEDRRRRFIHDLFCNDETFYIGEMRKIEALSTLDDVLIYIGQKYAWTPDNATAEEFVSWIANRFID